MTVFGEIMLDSVVDCYSRYILGIVDHHLRIQHCLVSSSRGHRPNGFLDAHLETSLRLNSLYDLLWSRTLLPQRALPKSSLEGLQSERFLIMLADHMFRAIGMLRRKDPRCCQADVVNLSVLALQPARDLLVDSIQRSALDLSRPRVDPVDVGRLGNDVVFGRIEVDLDGLGLLDDATRLHVQLGSSELRGSERLDHGDDRQAVPTGDQVDQGRSRHVLVRGPGPLDLARLGVQPVDYVTTR